MNKIRWGGGSYSEWLSEYIPCCLPASLRAQLPALSQLGLIKRAEFGELRGTAAFLSKMGRLMASYILHRACWSFFPKRYSSQDGTTSVLPF
jgi:DNA-binding HxlR family transcriptional regulator